MNVAVVSGNNSATQNVYEKLEKNGYGFLAAPLGNKENLKQSERLMQNALYEQYHDMKVVDFGSFIKQYPVILSTTHSIRRNIPEGRSFDYLIIDESVHVRLNKKR